MDDHRVARNSLSATVLIALACLPTSPARAANAEPAAAGGLAEVVVTAQKREQSLQDVSVAVTAIDSARLKDNFVLSMEDVQFIAPSVSFGNSLGYAKVFI